MSDLDATFTATVTFPDGEPVVIHGLRLDGLSREHVLRHVERRFPRASVEITDHEPPLVLVIPCDGSAPTVGTLTTAIDAAGE